MAEGRTPGFRALLSYHINSTSDVLRRAAALKLRRELDVSLMESRTLMLIDFLQPVRLRDLVADSGADKAQISRVVSSLVSRGFVVRKSHLSDGRSAQLELTQSGRLKLAGLARLTHERDRVLRECLDPAEVEALAGMLARLRAKAVELVREEARMQRGTRQGR
jgi:DNA-binding MarR family transcriptional regulator